MYSEQIKASLNERKTMRRKIVTTVVAVSAVLAFFVPNVSIGASATTTGPRALKDAVPMAVASGQVHAIGRLATTTRLRFIVTLKIRSWTELNHVLAAESTPGTARFGHYLTQNQANRLFNPTAAQQNQVSTWLRSNGISVTNTYVNHLMVDGLGSVGAIQRAFHVSLLRYAGMLYGRPAHFFAPSTAPIIPTSLSRIVNGVMGLDNTSRIVANPVRKTVSHPGVRPDGNASLGGYYPSDYRAAYEVPAGETGAGQHIGITLDTLVPSDAALEKWATVVGIGASDAPTQASGRLILHKVDGGNTSLDSEAAIDTETSYGMAPGAVIDYWEFSDGQSVDGAADALNGAGTTGPRSQGFNGWPIERQISSSWGLCEDSQDDSSNEDPVFASNSATGHDYLFASGDTGSYCPEYAKAASDDPFPQYPATSPWVTAVGATAFSTGELKSAPLTLATYPGEVSWYYQPKGNTQSDQCWSTSVPCPEGSSGGYSNQYKRPEWQVAPGLSPTANAGSCPATAGRRICRAFPDVSAAGDPNYSGAVVCYTKACEVDGGTSLASPIWAGAMADINSYLLTQDLVLGFANPAFYYLAQHSTYDSDFHDIQCPNKATTKDGGCGNGKYSTGPGWDAVTGLGSPDVVNLQAALAQ